MAVEVVVQFVGRGDQASRRYGAGLARRVQYPNESVGFAILDPLDAGPDIGTVQTVQSAVQRPAGYPFLRTASCREHDVPMRALMQAGEVASPDLVVFAKKPR